MSKRASRLRALLIAVLGAGVAGAAGYAIVNPPAITAAYLDFNAFYCGARILTAGSDPYRYEPLHSCETRNLQPATPNAVVPVPLPPYAVAAFAPLAQLSFSQARFAWWLLLLISGLLVVWAVAELSGLPLLLVGTCVLVSVLLPSLIVGSLALVPIALLSLSAVALVRGHATLAAALQAGACIEPHVAFPVLIAVFAFVPAMRWRLACVAAALLAASFAAGGASLNLEYVAQVLPAHAVSEIGNAEQYGISAVLHAFGLAERPATLVADAQYLLFIIGGLWLVRALRREMPESIVLVPMALAVTGGPFVHVTQIAAAIPLALVAAARTGARFAWAGLVLVAMAIPWQASIGYGAITAALVLFAVLAYNRVVWFIALPAAIAAGAMLWMLEEPELLPRHVAAIAPIAGSALAELPWRALADQFPPTPFSWYGHALVYAGLACTYGSLLLLARATHRAA